MVGENLIKIDPYMLLSLINMKLRDEYENLDVLCDDMDMDKTELEKKLLAVGYKYEDQESQFR